MRVKQGVDRSEESSRAARYGVGPNYPKSLKTAPSRTDITVLAPATPFMPDSRDILAPNSIVGLTQLRLGVDHTVRLDE
jgi:hypothetical protein